MNGDASKSVNQSTIDSLKVFLQEMMTTAHSLAMRHNSFTASKTDTHISSHESPSYPHFTDTGKANGLNNALKPVSPPFSGRRSYPGHEFIGLPRGYHKLTVAVETAAVSSEGCDGYSDRDVFNTQESGVTNTNNPLICRGSSEGPNYSFSKKESQMHSMDGLSFQECQSFLEEIKKTVQVWSLKHKSIDQACQVLKGKGDQACQVVKEKGDIVASQSGFNPVCNVVDLFQNSCFQSSSEAPEKKPAAIACYPEEGPSHSGAASQEMPDTLAEDACCVTLSHSKELEAFRSAHGVVSDVGNSKEKIVSGMNDNLNSGCSERYQVVSMSDDKITEPPSMSGCLGPIVESPNWLPHGWVTELKTRTGGRSAGHKYKCYFDPVSKRRFRTQKEVFCFLTTGNTGRYKRRLKDEQSEDIRRKGTFLNGALPNKSSSGHKRSYQTGMFPHCTDYVASEGSAKLSAPVLHTLLRGHTSSDGSDENSRALNDTSAHSGRGMYGGRMVDIQAAALRLLEQDDNMTLDARARLYARFSPRPGDCYGSPTPARNFKKTKAERKGRLKAPG